jgi:hypothetical protein
MLALMLNPCFKSLWVVENYVVHGNFTIEYDVKEFISLFMTIFERLNPIVQARVVAPINGSTFEDENEKTNMFNIGACIENLHGHWLMMNYFCFKGYLSLCLCVQIH